MFSRDEVNKMLSAERNKIKDELFQEYESKKSEAEKLAKMDAEQKLNYELDLKTEENEALTSELNSLKLKTQANTYANEKGLPLGYIEDWDFAKETADSVKERIDKLVKTRSVPSQVFLPVCSFLPLSVIYETPIAKKSALASFLAAST